MQTEEAARWMDMLCERSLKMDESRKFDQVAALIRAQAKVVEASRGPFTFESLRRLDEALAELDAEAREGKS